MQPTPIKIVAASAAAVFFSVVFMMLPFIQVNPHPAFGVKHYWTFFGISSSASHVFLLFTLLPSCLSLWFLLTNKKTLAKTLAWINMAGFSAVASLIRLYVHWRESSEGPSFGGTSYQFSIGLIAMAACYIMLLVSAHWDNIEKMRRASTVSQPRSRHPQQLPD